MLSLAKGLDLGGALGRIGLVQQVTSEQIAGVGGLKVVAGLIQALQGIAQRTFQPLFIVAQRCDSAAALREVAEALSPDGTGKLGVG